MRVKIIIRKTVCFARPLFKLILSAFFERQYLAGRHFDIGFDGYIWAARAIWTRNILRLAAPMPWPVALTCTISNPKNILFHPDNLDNFQTPGAYFQNFSGQIVLGFGTYVAPNVGIITANHKLYCLDEHEDAQNIFIGEHCWIGMNSIILPGVQLGNHTIVAAGSVVTNSFPAGAVVVGGVPARILKNLDPEMFNKKGEER